jgi:phosphoglycerate dehydrogenase-like enzyme
LGSAARTTATFVVLPPVPDKHRSWAQRLVRDIPDLEVRIAEDAQQARELLPRADAALGTLTPELLRAAERLRWLQAPMAAPPVGYYFPELIDHPVLVTNLRGVYTDHVATHATALVLALARGFQRHLANQFRRVWQQDRSPHTVIHLPEATLLIVGMGAVGSLIADQCRAFGLQIVGVDADRTSHPWVPIHPPDALDMLLPEADILVMTVPHTPVTGGMIDARRLALMKRGAVLVNIGRGGTVCLAALIDALRVGQLAGAALDVFEEEPLPPSHPLWEAPNVLITPHVGVTGPYFEERQYLVVVDNARRFVAGRPLVNLVDKTRWY